ncbi:MAG: ATP-binding protein [Myxococcota bacterium]|nr:ATP-binding protein [Myxococcota bacterium]
MIRRLDVKIVLTLIVTVFLPLGVSVFLVATAIETSLGLGLNAEIADQLEQALAAQKEHIEVLKQSVRLRFNHLIDSHLLAQAAIDAQDGQLRQTLGAFLTADPSLRRICLFTETGQTLEVEDAEDLDVNDARTMLLESDVTLGPFTRVEALYAVDAGVMAAYKGAGEQYATYRALVNAPPEYLGNRFVWVYLTILGFAAVVSVTIGILWARRLVRRIHSLAMATRRVARGDLSVSERAGANDEVGQLVESFNSMVAELAANRARIEYLQKISAWQEMARRLAHEIKNPLTPIQLAAQQVREKYTGDDPAFERLLSQSTEIIGEEVATLRRLTSDFSSFAKLPEIHPKPVDLRGFLEECETSLLPVMENEGVAIAFSTPTEKIAVSIDRIMMKRVIDNLVRNAAEAIKEADVASPVISVSAGRYSGHKRSEVMIRIEDNGPGILPEHHPSIFDPYFTTKSEGTGLGLAISKKIVLEHGGLIWMDELPTGGAAFSIVLPAES